MNRTDTMLRQARACEWAAEARSLRGWRDLGLWRPYASQITSAQQDAAYAARKAREAYQEHRESQAVLRLLTG